MDTPKGRYAPPIWRLPRPRTAGGSPSSSGLSSAAGAPTRTRCRVRCRSSSAGVSMRSPVHGRDAAERSGFPRSGFPSPEFTEPGLSDAQVLQILDRGPHLAPASHVVQSSLSGNPGTPVARPTATSWTPDVASRGARTGPGAAESGRPRKARSRTNIVPRKLAGGPATNVADVARGQPAPPA